MPSSSTSAGRAAAASGSREGGAVMKLCQFEVPGAGRRVGVVEGAEVVDITARAAGVGSVLDLVRQGRTPAGVERLARRLARAPRRPRHPWSALDPAPRPRPARPPPPLHPPP